MPIVNVWNVPIDVEGSHELAELHGIILDLENVVELCKIYFRENSTMPVCAFVLEAISIAALIKYSRCFGKGVRARIDVSTIEKLPFELRIVHQIFDDVRDKHYAHSVNTY